jgi:hypothetical protein
MIITSNGRSHQTPSSKGRKGKIQWLDWVSCPDTEIWVLPNLGISVDRVSCPDTNIRVLTTRFPWASCFKETHSFYSRNMGVHVQCTCAPSAKGGEGKIQRLDRVSCLDMEIWVLPNLGIALDWVSCPDTNIGVLTTRFPQESCFKETHKFCSRNMGVHVQCTCAKKWVSSNFAKIMSNYIQKRNMLSCLAVSGNVWGGSTSSDVSAVHNYNLKKKVQFFGGINWWHSRTPIRCLPGKRIIVFQYYVN